MSNELINSFESGSSFNSEVELTGSQHITANNNKFLRYSWEVSNKKILEKEWVIYCKGGSFRRWYGNTELVLDWSRDAQVYYKTNPTSNYLQEKYQFRKGITWSDITANKLSFRLNDSWIFDKKGPTFFIDDNWFLYALALANSAVVQYLNPAYPNGIAP